jgi:hypothetical protein
MYKIENIDKRICDIEPTATNKQTYRQFIREVESGTGLEPIDFKVLSDKELTEYIEFLDYIEGK